MAGAHRPRPPPTPTAPESGDAISELYRKCRFSVSCPECRGGPSWSRTLRVAFSGRGAWIACRWGFGTYGNLKATAALTTLRITSTVSHPHRALCWFPATWPTAGGPPQVPCHPPALAPPRRTTQPALARSSPPAPAASKAPAFLPVHPIRLRTWAVGTWLPLPGRRPDLPQPSSRLSPSPVPGCFLSAFCLFPLCPPPSSALYTLILPSRRHQPAKPPLHRPPNPRATPNPNPLLIESRPSESLT